MTQGKLYLTGIYRGCSSEEVPTALLFPGRALPVAADWFNGELRLPKGELLDYVHMGWGSQHEKDVFLKFIGGHLVERREVDHTLVPAVKAYSDLARSCRARSAWDCDDSVLKANMGVIKDFQAWRDGGQRPPP